MSPYFIIMYSYNAQIHIECTDWVELNLLMHVELPSLTHIWLQLIAFNALPITSIFYLHKIIQKSVKQKVVNLRDRIETNFLTANHSSKRLPINLNLDIKPLKMWRIRKLRISEIGQVETIFLTTNHSSKCLPINLNFHIKPLKMWRIKSWEFQIQVKLEANSTQRLEFQSLNFEHSFSSWTLYLTYHKHDNPSASIKVPTGTTTPSKLWHLNYI